MHSINIGLIVVHLFVCVRFNLFLYILLIILVSFHWSSLGKVLCSPDNHQASHIMCKGDYIV